MRKDCPLLHQRYHSKCNKLRLFTIAQMESTLRIGGLQFFQFEGDGVSTNVLAVVICLVVLF